MARNPADLFNGETVALVGASERGHYARSIIQNQKELGFDLDNLFLINPNRDHVLGLQCYTSIGSIAKQIDIAVLAVPGKLVRDIVFECAEHKVKSVVILADGFAESGQAGQALQEEITAIARANGMGICGPNTLGFISMPARLGLWGGGIPKLPAGNISALFQSGGSLNLLFSLLENRQLGLRHAVATGNQAVWTIGDYLDFLVEDAGTSTILVFLEALRDTDKFLSALEKASRRGKPVVVMRVGRSERGGRNVIAHSGNLASAGNSADAVLKQFGAVLVPTIDQMLETGALFSQLRPGAQFAREGMGFVTISGGDCTLLCDLCEDAGVALPNVEQPRLQEMADMLHKSSLLGNPLDSGALVRENPEEFYHLLSTFSSSEAIDLVGIRLALPKEPNPDFQDMYRRTVETVQRCGKQPVVFTRASEALSGGWYAFFASLQVPFLQEYSKGLRAVKSLLQFQKWRQRHAVEENENNAAQRPADTEIMKLKGLVQANPSRILDFALAQKLMQAYGITLAGELVHSVGEATEAAARLGYPVAIKISSADIAHKSELGVIRLGIGDAEELAAAYEEIWRKARAATQARIEGMVIQPMIQGLECIVGMHNDRQLGPVMLFGLGGIFVEVLKDISLRHAPLTEGEAQTMLQEIKGYPLLLGARGRPPADMPEIKRALVSFSLLAHDFGGALAEVDLNPLVALPAGKGVLALDALFVKQVEGWVGHA